MSTVKESLSIEETNKIRVSLGLKPLPVPTDGDSGGDSKPKDAADDAPQDADSLAEANYAARRSKEAQEKATADLQARLDRSKNKRELAAKLKGRGLGDLIEGEADESTDLKSWIKKSKKRQKQLAAEAAKKEKELAELEGPAYAEKDLEGLKVGHEAEDFEQGEDVILTLKDSRILDGDEDELHNVNLSEAAKSKEALALKRKGRQEYTGLDDEEFEGVPGQRKEVLNKYKETIEGKEGRSFRLGAAADERPDAAMEVDQIGGVAEASRQSRKAAAAEELKRELLSGEYQKNFETDYLQEGDPGFKKPKKSKKKKDRSTRKPTAADDDFVAPNGDAMDLDTAPVQSAPVFDDGPGGGLDDEEVQAAMARMRREAGRMRNRTMKAVSAQELARRREELLQKDVKAEDEEDEEDLRGDTAGDADGEVRVLDDTTEFIRNIGLAQREQAEAAAKKAAEEAARAASASAAPTPAPRIKKEEDGDVALEELGDEDVEMGEESPDEEEKAELLRLLAGDEAKPEAEGGEVEGIGGTGKEQYVSGGLAATLSILKQQGLIKPLTEEEREKERMYREKTAWQTEQRRLDALRKLERQQSRKAGGNKDQAQREYENRQREAQAARDAMESFRHYKPHVEIKYNDEFGRVLSPKEAWKALSHKFHGKGSGKTKTEKRIKKIEEEKKMEAMASGDTPTGTNEAFQKRQQALGSATMVLSVGNKGSAPQQEELLATISKNPKAKSKGKAREANSGAKASPAPDLMSGLGVASSLPSSAVAGVSGLSGTATPTLLPRKTAGFKPIAAQRTSTPTAAGTDSPVTNGTPRIAIGLGGTKRKAEDEPEGSPNAKRLA